MPSAVVIVPARYASTRFPGKVLAPLLGRPMLHHVIEGVAGARRISGVYVAVDDERVARAAEEAGALALWTREDHPSGTDRVAEAAAGLEAEVIVNVQGDEPLVRAETVDDLAAALLDEEGDAMTTLCEPLERVEDLFDPNVVKVVTGLDGRALYFSRSPLPYRKGRDGAMPLDFRARLVEGDLSAYRRHVGLYGYRRETLLALAETPPTPLELSEGLEQLRALETGRAIRVLPSRHRALGVDTPEDLIRAETLMKASQT
jgi:3-deoxy-manno-octulosonate cytidylyltransferase (CMP-KDO synthetase)